MSKNTPTLVAGEPRDVLLQGLDAMNPVKRADGSVSFDFVLDAETGTAWARAIERYGADLIEPGHHDPVEQRHADAFMRICVELTESLADRRQTRKL